VVAASGTSSLAFVVSAGQGYLVDVDARQVIHKSKTEQLNNAFFVPRSNKVVACDWTNIFVFTREGLVWDSGRVSYDGINFAEVSDELVRGTVNNLSDEWPEFVLQFDPISYSCPWRYRE